MVMRKATAISQRRACQLVGLSRTVLHYVSKAQPENEQLQARLVELAGERRRFGYRRLHALVRREGVRANHKRIYRLYSDAGLSVRRRKKRHGVAVSRTRHHGTSGLILAWPPHRPAVASAGIAPPWPQSPRLVLLPPAARDRPASRIRPPLLQHSSGPRSV